MLNYVNKYDYVSEIGTKKVEFKRWTSKEEKAYLNLIEVDESTINDEKLYSILIEPCIKDKTLIFTPAEQKKLITDIRIESISPLVEDKHTCTKCDNTQDIEFKIKDFIKFKTEDFNDIIVEDRDEKFTFILHRHVSPGTKKILRKEKKLIDYIFTDFILHIKEIRVQTGKSEDDTLVHTEFTLKELTKFMDSLPTIVFDEVFQKYQRMLDKTILNYEFECSECGETYPINYDNIPNFLWV